MADQQETSERERYQQYLCSRKWSVLRAAVLERSGGTCERCRRNPGDHVHHLTYARKYNERLEDLIHLCKACHEFVHAHSGVDPREQINEKVQLADGYGYFAGLLHCPYCREVMLHHRYVVVYDRREDADSTKETFVTRGTSPYQRDIASTLSANPSSRRDAVAIGFWCECCDLESELTIEQHKGSTYLHWRKPQYDVDIWGC